MRIEKMIDNLYYVVEFEDNEFKFYIDVNKSVNALNFIDEESLRFGDVPNDFEYKTKHNKEFMKVYKLVRRFIENVIKNKSPFYFCYVANQKEKISLYNKFAIYIGNKYGYYVDVDNNKFSFYKRNYD